MPLAALAGFILLNSCCRRGCVMTKHPILYAPCKEHHFTAPQLNILKRNDQTHRRPVILLGLLVASGFAGMAVLGPASGSALAGIPSAYVDRAPLKLTDRLPAGPGSLLNADAACVGQAWGSETADCIEAIKRESGNRSPRALRVVAAGIEAAPQVPNVF